ncbi:OmpA family protein [Paucibacter sp. APW11]|uniref:OmpA family protein n=1 Tax=Roseateles aquae TaxID=3077235 RepID=A0ABU3PGM2_9BURK|nr:OmpA family protein [Paucibacter sp. APW11]MDT9001653.1 OmpA family protein [Paucibacter sp. APW11]
MKVWRAMVDVKRWVAVAAMMMLGATLPAQAAEPLADKAGGSDHPLISRYQGSILFNYGSNHFEQVRVPLGPKQSETVEGRTFNYFYLAPKDSSPLEVLRNYKQALEQSRFKILLACEDAPQCRKANYHEHARFWTDKTSTFVGGYSPSSRIDDNGNYPPRVLVARLARPEGDVTVVLTVIAPSSSEERRGTGGPYFLQVIESQAMAGGQVQVKADALAKGLAAEGRIALYGILFDSARAELKEGSKPQLDEMAALLAKQPALKVFIVGHTDNQGGLEGNLALSQRRAEAVTAALVKDYKIDAKRLSARGLANLAPVASNAAEAGRALNRRVELVEQ